MADRHADFPGLRLEPFVQERGAVTMATDVTVRLDGAVAVLCLDGAERMNAIGSHTYRALAAAVSQPWRTTGRPGQSSCTARAGRSPRARTSRRSADSRRPSEFRQFIHGFTDALALLERSPPADRRGDQRPRPRRRARAGHGMRPAGRRRRRQARPARSQARRAARRGRHPAAAAAHPARRGHRDADARAHHRRRPGLPAGPGEPAGGQRGRGPDGRDDAGRELAAGPCLVPARAKALLRETAGAELGDGIAREREVATELFATPDGQEGFAAFRERRVPAFAAGQPS